MPIDPSLKNALESLIGRRRRLKVWCNLAAGWAACGLFAVGLMLLQRTMGWGSWLGLPLVALLAVVVFILALRDSRGDIDWRNLATAVESRYPELNGRLLTAVQQQPGEGGEFNYFQRRLLEEALAHRQHNDWAEVLPNSRIRQAQALHWSALLLFAFVLPGLRTTGGDHLLARITDSRLSVTPGDASVEKGNSLVVLARFSGRLPSVVDVVVGEGTTPAQRIPLAKSLADPVFGGSLPDIQSNLVYRVEYGGRKTREFKVDVFEYPRLESADIDLLFPEYTKLPPKHIANTRRLSAVEGSRVDLKLQLNKPVVSARLAPKDRSRAVIPLQVETNQPVAVLKQFPLAASQNYDLQLVDAEGRTNKASTQFIFVALTNRSPEFQLASPRGDQRPSSLEEVVFEGTVWDDFGLPAFGLGYAIPGRETEFVELGRDVPGREKRSFKFVLRLEDLDLKPDQLISWFVWGDDIDSDGHVRRTTGDLFFGEIRPFEEVFREGMSMDGQSAGMSGQRGNPGSRLTELQKQIINATWRLRRDHSSTGSPQSNLLEPQNRTVYAEDKGPSLSLRERAGLSSVGPAKEEVRGYSLSLGERAGVRGTFFGQTAGREPGPGQPNRARFTVPAPKPGAVRSYQEDATVVHDSQAQAIEQAELAAGRVDDPREEALWAAAIAEMEKARARLQAATNSPAALADALAAEQAAYQALLKVQQHEYQVVRNQNRSQSGGGGRDQQMQRQLEQMELTQSENRYETQRQAQRPQNNERREELQVMSRLQELARRQQDLNNRLKELQSALEEARTEQEREEIRRRLKRLQEEEQQMLADVDELRQRMDRPENQSRMADERRQLEETRDDVQRAAEAAGRESPSQALASGTRAQRQLQQLRDEMRKKNSSQFADDLREMRSEARELARRQEEITKKMQAQLQEQRGRLSDSTEVGDLAGQLDAQKERLTNLVQRATEISQQAEEPEPLLSRQLYDTLRKYTQDTAHNVQEAESDLLNRRLLTRELYQRLKNPSESDGAKLLDLTSDLWRQEIRREDFRREAAGTAQRARAGIDDFKSGVERAADSVLGDDTEALRMAEQGLKELTEQLQREMAEAEGADSTNKQNSAGQRAGNEQATPGQKGSSQRDGSQSEQASANPTGQATSQSQGQNNPGEKPQAEEQPSRGQSPGQTGQQGQASQQNGQQAGQQPGSSGQQQDAQQGGQRGNASGEGQNQTAQDQRDGSNPRDGSARGGSRRGSRSDQANRAGGQDYGGGGGGWDWNRFWNDPSQPQTWPLTGQNFGPWSDSLRDVEEMIEDPALRNEVAVARERARLMRQEFKRDRKKPDWAVVRLQVVNPLAEVRNRIADELARRQSNDALVPIDRDPVPSRYSDLVRRYYEELGRGSKP
jgi:hypothetical protein